jgi:hypothetical protein
MAATRHGGESEIRDHRTQPHQRSAGGPHPVPGELVARRSSHVVIRHRWHHLGRRSADHREPTPGQLGSGHPGQDPLHQGPMGPGRVTRRDVREQALVDVDAPEVGPRGHSGIELAMQPGERFQPRPVDGAVGDRDEVEVAHARDVVTRRQRPGHPQVEHPPERRQPAGQRSHGGRHVLRGHRDSLPGTRGEEALGPGG